MKLYRCKYEYSLPFGSPRHIWTCIGALGAMHLHITDYGEERAAGIGQRYSGGLETHYRAAPDYMREQAPSQDKCWLLEGPCWHDGTSLYAQERLIPFWLIAPQDHDRMFRMLEQEYEDRFMSRADAA